MAEGLYASQKAVGNDSCGHWRGPDTVTIPSTAVPGPNARYVFVCYAHDERDLVVEQIRWLRANGFEIWFDEAIEAGTRWSEDLARAVEGSAAVLYFLSPTSANSRYCLDEIHFALECGRPIVPVETEPVTLTPGLRLGLGGTHRIFMHRMSTQDFRDKLASGLRAALEGNTALAMHAGPAAPVRHGTQPAPVTGMRGYLHPLLIGAAVAVAVAVAISVT